MTESVWNAVRLVGVALRPFTSRASILVCWQACYHAPDSPVGGSSAPLVGFSPATATESLCGLLLLKCALRQ